MKGSCVIKSNSSGTGTQKNYNNEGATRGGVLVMFRCTTPGTKGSSEPAAFATSGLADIGSTIPATGGTAVWTVESIPKDHQNGKAYVLGERVVIPGDPDHIFEVIAAGTSMSGSPSYTGWGIPGHVPGQMVAPPYADQFFDVNTSIARDSNGVSLPTGIISVGSTANFSASGMIQVKTSAGIQNVTYTAKTATTFTGCTGGTGTMSTGRGGVAQGTLRWKCLSAAGVTVLANWCELQGLHIAGFMGCAVWAQCNVNIHVPGACRCPLSGVWAW
jgi:hypothetical protein